MTCNYKTCPKYENISGEHACKHINNCPFDMNDDLKKQIKKNSKDILDLQNILNVVEKRLRKH